MKQSGVFHFQGGSGLRRALVALDGSEFSWRALTAAIDRAREVPGTVLHLLTVQIPSEEIRTRRLAAMKTDWVLRQAEQRIPSDGPRYTKEVLEGDPARVIAQRAGQLKCEVIFVGVRGVGASQREGMGSVAARLCTVSDIPVRIIK